jgi:DNA polymerase elongation subunit (family B)
MTDIVNVDYVHKDTGREHPVFFVSHRNGLKKTIETVDEFFNPYFYVSADQKSAIDAIINTDPQLAKKVLKVEPSKKTIFGTDTLKITTSHISRHHFEKLRNFFDSHTWEDDVVYQMRYIIDKEIKYSQDQRIHYIDIETDMCLDVRDTPEPITCLCVYDNLLEKYFLWCWREDLSKHKKVDGDTTYYYFDSEYEMLTSYLKFTEVTDPDILTGWNNVNFDMPYIINRMKRLGLDYNRMCGLEYKRVDVIVARDRDNSKVRIAGRAVVDMYQIYKKLTYDNKPDNYKLSTVAKHELKEDKIAISSPGELWRNDIEKLLEYNKQDVYLLARLDESNHLTGFFRVMQSLVPVPLEYAQWNSKICDGYLLHNFKHVAFPSKRHRDKTVRPKGALTGKIVQDENGEWTAVAPDPGIYKMVAVFDFSKMYPSIFTTFNISPETIDEENGDIHCETKFSSAKRGIIPQVFHDVTKQREEIKDEMKKHPRDSQEFNALKNLQGGVKQIANSFFGTSGFPSFRMYDLRVLSAIMYMGRQMLIHTTIKAKEQGYDVLYGDTDSIFIPLKRDYDVSDKEQFAAMIKEMKALEKVVDDYMQNEFAKQFYPTCEKSDLHIECEKVFSDLVLFDVKKKYIGRLCWQEGAKTQKMFQRGVAIVKRDTPAEFKKILKKLTVMIIDKDPIEDIEAYLEKAYTKIRTLNHWQIGLTKNLAKHFNDYQFLTKTGKPKKQLPHIRAAKYSNEILGTNFGKGDYPKVVYVKHKDTDVIAVEDDEMKVPEEYEINYDEYIKKHIHRYLDDFVTVYPDLVSIKGVKKPRKKKVKEDEESDDLSGRE